MSKANGTVVKTVPVIDPEAMQDAMLKIITAVIDTGIVTQDELASQVGDGQMTLRALEALSKKKFITKRDGGTEFKNATVWSLQNQDIWQNKSPLTVYMEIKGAEREREDVYKGYKTKALSLRLLTPCLAGTPTSDQNLIDFRRSGERIWLSQGYFHACMRDAARLLSEPAIPYKARQAIKNGYVFIADVYLEKAALMKERVPCPAPGGRGISRHEAIAPDTIISFVIRYPDVLTENDIERIWGEAGQWIGFSVAKHGQGWGRFKMV